MRREKRAVRERALPAAASLAGKFLGKGALPPRPAASPPGYLSPEESAGAPGTSTGLRRILDRRAGATSFSVWPRWRDWAVIPCRHGRGQVRAMERGSGGPAGHAVPAMLSAIC